MHEASLVLGMIPVIEKSLRENKGQFIVRVVTKIGRLSGIDVNSFEFAFDAIKLDYPWLKDSVLTIIEVPIKYRCKDCGTEFETENFHFPECSQCKSKSLELMSGEDLYLETLEIEEGD